MSLPYPPYAPSADIPASVVNSAGATNLYVPVANGANGYAWAAQTGGGSVTSPNGTITVTGGNQIDVVYGTGSNTAAQGNDVRITGAAPLASPALTGTPTVPTASPGTNTTQAASTAFVAAAVALDLPLTGGTMSGAIAMGANKVTGLAAGSAPTEAPNLTQISRQWVRNNGWSAFKDQTFDLAGGGSTGSALTTQKVCGTLIGLLAGDVVTNIFIGILTAGSGTAPTGFYLGLFSKTGAQLAITTNQNSSTKLTSVGIPSFAVTSPYTVPTTDVYYMAVLENGAFASTAVAIGHGVQIAGVSSAGSVNTLTVGQTGQAIMPSPATFVAGTENIWFGWS